MLSKLLAILLGFSLLASCGCYISPEYTNGLAINVYRYCDIGFEFVRKDTVNFLQKCNGLISMRKGDKWLLPLDENKYSIEDAE